MYHYILYNNIIGIYEVTITCNSISFNFKTFSLTYFWEDDRMVIKVRELDDFSRDVFFELKIDDNIFDMLEELLQSSITIYTIYEEFM